MTLTYGQLRSHVQLAVGGDPSTAPGMTTDERVAQIINHAGEHLFARGWRFRERTSGTITTVASQPWVGLPSDCGEVLVVEPSNTWSSSFSFVDPASFQRIASAGVDPELSYVATLVFHNVTDGVEPRLDLYPTPAAATELSVRYRAMWVELSGDDVDGTSDASTVDTIPAYVEGLLLEYVRAFTEGGEDGTTQARLLVVDQGILLDRALRKDGSFQPDYGQLPYTGYPSSLATYAAGTVDAPAASNLLWRGTWSGSNTYSVDDLVHYAANGNSYICIQDTTASGEIPTNASYWDVFTAT